MSSALGVAVNGDHVNIVGCPGSVLTGLAGSWPLAATWRFVLPQRAHSDEGPVCLVLPCILRHHQVSPSV